MNWRLLLGWAVLSVLLVPIALLLVADWQRRGGDDPELGSVLACLLAAALVVSLVLVVLRYA